MKTEIKGLNESNPDINLVPGSIKGAMKAASAGSRDLWLVPRSRIRIIEGFNVRVDNDALKAHIRWLADSIKEHGFKFEHPLAGYVARDGDESVIYLFDGHCRIKGFDLARSEKEDLADALPIVVGSQTRDIEELTVSLWNSNGGKPLEPLEKAAVCKRLSHYGWDEVSIASKLSISKNYVTELLTLIGSPKAIRLMVAEGKVSAAVATNAIRTHGDKAQEVLEKGLALAADSGKAKVTQRFLADPSVKVYKKTAPELFTAVQVVRNDPGYAGLSDAAREKLDAVLAMVEEGLTKQSKSAEKAAAKASSNPPGDERLAA